MQPDVVVFSFSALDQHYLIYAVFYVEFTDVLPELTCLDLGKV